MSVIERERLPRYGYKVEIDPRTRNIFFQDQNDCFSSDWKEKPYKPRVFMAVNITPSMIYEVDEAKGALCTSYKRTMDCLKKLAFYSKRKKGLPFTTYIGRRQLTLNDLWKENTQREDKEIISDMMQFHLQMQFIKETSKPCPDDTLILFTDTGATLTSSFVGFPCRTQVIFMDMKYDQRSKHDFQKLTDKAEKSLDVVTLETRTKDFKTMVFSKCKAGEVIYRIAKDHLLKNPVRIYLGRLKQAAMLYPECRFLPKGNLHIVGFMKSGSLANMPIFSKHILTQPHLITISRKEVRVEHKKKIKKRKKKHVPVLKKLQNTKNKRRSLGLLYMLKECLKNDEMIALARYKTGQYCAIYSTNVDPETEQDEEFGVALLDVLQEFELDELVPYQFEGEINNPDAPPQDCHIESREKQPVKRHPFNIPSSWRNLINPEDDKDNDDNKENEESAETDKEKPTSESNKEENELMEEQKKELETLNYVPSYGILTFKSWQVNDVNTEAQGLNNDFQKVFRLLKKVIEKPENFYTEINKIRDYSITIGMNEKFLFILSDFIKKQSSVMSDAIQKHAQHICKHLELDLTVQKYSQIPIYDEKVEVPIIPIDKVEVNEHVINVPSSVPKEAYLFTPTLKDTDLRLEQGEKNEAKETNTRGIMEFPPEILNKAGKLKRAKSTKFNQAKKKVGQHVPKATITKGDQNKAQKSQKSITNGLSNKQAVKNSLQEMVQKTPFQTLQKTVVPVRTGKKTLARGSQNIPPKTDLANSSQNIALKRAQEVAQKITKLAPKSSKKMANKTEYEPTPSYKSHYYHDDRDRGCTYDYDRDREYRPSEYRPFGYCPPDCLPTDFGVTIVPGLPDPRNPTLNNNDQGLQVQEYQEPGYQGPDQQNTDGFTGPPRPIFHGPGYPSAEYSGTTVPGFPDSAYPGPGGFSDLPSHPNFCNQQSSPEFQDQRISDTRFSGLDYSNDPHYRQNDYQEHHNIHYRSERRHREERRHENRKSDERRYDDRRYDDRRDYRYDRDSRSHRRDYYGDRDYRRDEHYRRDSHRDRDRDRDYRVRDHRDDKRTFFPSRRCEDNRVASYKDGHAAASHRDQRPNVYGAVYKSDKSEYTSRSESYRREDDARNKRYR